MEIIVNFANVGIKQVLTGIKLGNNIRWKQKRPYSCVSWSSDTEFPKNNKEDTEIFKLSTIL